jgi:lysophospholipase L1-like esterase
VLAINLGNTIVLWFCLEVAFGFFMDGRVSVQSKIQFATMMSRDFTEADDGRGFRLRSNFSSPMIHTNSQGFRGKELPQDLGDKRLIIALGESTTFGFGVGDDESYPCHLETILNSTSPNQQFVVVNAGVPSYSSRQVFLYAEELLASLHPDFVVVNIFWNDLFYSSLEEWTPQSLVPRYPSNWQRTMFKYSRVYRWLTSKPAKQELVDFYSTDALMEYKNNIANIIGLCKSKNIPVLFVEPPFSEQWIGAMGVTIWQNRFTKQFVTVLADIFLAIQIEESKSQQVPFIRHRLGVSERPTGEDFLDFLHTNSEGNHIIAESIADFLHDNYPPAPRK